MKIKIRIRTPKGQATKSEKKLRPFLIGKKVISCESYISPDDDEVIWNIEGKVKRILKISRNVTKFDMMMKGVLNMTMVKKALASKLSDDERKDFFEMIDSTTVDIVKEATASEMDESNKSWFDNIKEKFKKK